MKPKKSARISIKDIALEAGVSKSTAGFALLNRPGPSKETRDHVLRIAKRLGYVPDARIASWMARVREAKSKDLLPIAWVNTEPIKNAWHKYKFFTPYLEGARERALELGYRLEELWLYEAGVTMARFARTIYQRGFEGVIVTSPAQHLRLDWDKLAGVSLGEDLLIPRLHRVNADIIYNILLTLKILKRNGYRRIGICLQEYFRDRADSFHLAAHFFYSSGPKLSKIPPLFYIEKRGDSSLSQRQIRPWLSRYKPDVIVCHNNQIVTWIEKLGYRVPDDIGVVHLATDDDVSDWAGIHSNRREIGTIAVELLVSLIHHRQFGVPEIARSTLVRGSWHPGRTVLLPKPEQTR